VQSALLEAMEEKQVTVGQKSYPLPELFMVLATKNPIEHEGTYNLPEAQLDRFLMHVVVDYPDHDEELQILKLDHDKATNKAKPDIKTTTQKEIFTARQEMLELYIDPKLDDYIVSLVLATRDPEPYSKELAKWLRFGASPRASIAIAKCAKALAWLNNDEYVSPYHIQTVVPNIMRHRIILSFEAEADGIIQEQVIKHLLEVVATP